MKNGVVGRMMAKIAVPFTVASALSSCVLVVSEKTGNGCEVICEDTKQGRVEAFGEECVTEGGRIKVYKRSTDRNPTSSWPTPACWTE